MAMVQPNDSRWDRNIFSLEIPESIARCFGRRPGLTREGLGKYDSSPGSDTDAPRTLAQRC